MTAQMATTTVRTSVVVQASLDRAFKVFTEDFGQFKPREHNLLGVEIAETVFEPRVGGHLFDRGIDGSECRWARVLAYEPPHRVVLSWDINARWQLETDLARRAKSRCGSWPRRPTAPALEHRHLNRHGDGWESISDGVSSNGGWPLYLQRYAALF